jgi:PKD domain-containing protein
MLPPMRHGLHGRSLVGLLAAVALCLLAAVPAAGAGLAPDHAFPAPAVDAPEVTSAIAPNGYAIVAWAETLSGGQSRVDVALHPPGGDWSMPQGIGLTTGTIPNVDVAIDASGAAALAWDESASGNSLVATQPAGGSFGAPETIVNGEGARVGIAANGQVTLLYGITGGGAESVRTAAAGSSLLAASPTTLSPTCGTTDADLAVAPNGDAIAGFACQDASFALRAGGTWTTSTSPTFTHTSASPCVGLTGGGTSTSYSGVHVAIDGQGHVAGVVEQTNLDTNCPIGAPMTSDAVDLALPAAGTTATVASSSGESVLIPPDDVRSPSIGIGGGSVVVGWRQGDATGVNFQPSTRTYPNDGLDAPGAPQPLSSPTNAFADGRVAVGAHGEVLDTWEEEPSGGTHLIAYAAYRAAGAASFGAPLQVSDGTTDAANVGGAFAAGGDGVVAYRDARGGGHVAHARGFDVTPPAITAFALPASATVGVPASFAAGASDLWGPVSLSWSFGDGSGASGGSVSHAFAAAGAHTVTVTATDGAGNASSESGSVNVLAAAAAGSPPTPVLSQLSETHKRFRVGRTRTAVSAVAARRKHRAPVGTTFRFTLSEAAVVSIRIERKLAGRVSGGRCVKPTRRLAHKRRCTRYVLVKTLVRRHLRAGANRVAFSGRIGRRALALGSYRAIFTPSAAGRNGRAHALRFTIVR